MKKSRSKHLNFRKKVSRDEVYTSHVALSDQIKEWNLQMFVGATVMCPFNDLESAFGIFLRENFFDLQLRKLILTGSVEDKTQIFIKEGGSEHVLISDEEYSVFNDIHAQLLKECDFVFSNPPFSKLRAILSYFWERKINFIILSPTLALGYKIIFEGFKKEIIGARKSKIKTFHTLEGDELGVGVVWIMSTNFLKYIPFEYKKAPSIEMMNDILRVDRIRDIPWEYEGIMAVPITFLLDPQILSYKIMNVMRPCSEEGKQYFSRLVVQKKELGCNQDLGFKVFTLEKR